MRKCMEEKGKKDLDQDKEQKVGEGNEKRY